MLIIQAVTICRGVGRYIKLDGLLNYNLSKKLTLCSTNSWKSWTIWIWRRFWRSWYCHQFFCPQQRSTVRSQQHWQILFSWQRRLYQIFATWSWRTGKCQNCQRSSSSHVFTNPESTNLRIFFKKISLFLFFCMIEVFFIDQKCR